MIIHIILALGLSALALGIPQARGTTPPGKGIQWVGNSFHWFLASPVSRLAKEAGIVGHHDVGNDRIGGSEPCQHWNKSGGQVKDVLAAGKADIVTMTYREKVPDQCVPKFVELAVSFCYSPKNVRASEKNGAALTIDESANSAVEQCQAWGCANRNAATYEMIEQTRATMETPYRNRIRSQLVGFNQQYGGNLTSMVPVYSAILELRKMVVKGQLPGVAKQSNLFMDNLGHPQKPVSDMASYMWFAAIYGINPQGMTALSKGSPAGQTPILQKLAWDILKSEPLNGIN